MAHSAWNPTPTTEEARRCKCASPSKHTTTAATASRKWHTIHERDSNMVQSTRPAAAARPAKGATTMAMINILVVDDHPIVREGLVAILEAQDDFNVVGE